MPRFYCPQPLSVGAIVVLPEAVAHHVQVVRLNAGASITLFTGQGGSFSAVLTEIERRRVEVRIESFDAGEVELPYAVTLAQALPEAAKMDWIIEKAVELGAETIQPLAAQRCVVRLSAEREAKKQAHWQGIVIAASEQSGRNRLSDLEPVADFRQWIARDHARTCLLLSPRAETSLAAWAGAQAPQDITIAVGPEGGFTPEEEDMAIGNGAVLVSMGPRILRTETAGLAAVATLNALWDVVA
jgi:16S rRNA (uracil1498-N3)-methyltransferase